MNLVETLRQLRDDIKIWVTVNLNALNAKIDEKTIFIDDELSSTSTNPVQNKTIKKAIDNIPKFSGSYNDLTDAPNIFEDGSGNMTIADEAGNIIFKVDSDGINTTKVSINGNTAATEGYVVDIVESIKEELNESITSESEDLKIIDEAGNIIFNVNADGVHTTDLTLNGESIKNIVDEKIASLVDSAPETLNTLNELAEALSDDENFANTVTTELSQKANTSDLVQSDWNQTDETALDFIKNKPNSVGKNVAGQTFDVYNPTINDIDHGLVAGEGAEIFNDYEGNYAIGKWSHAEGVNNIATGWGSHAEGKATCAYGYFSHAEGSLSNAIGSVTHAEGNSTTASGNNSHAEGIETYTVGIGSHAEGYRTSASSDYSHAQGKCNVYDNEKIYAHIVGNGANQDELSNAHTIDWDGNAWFAGDVYVGSTSGTNKDDGSKKLATEEYVDIRVPSWTEADEGKFLQIVNGVPTWASIPLAEEATFGVSLISFTISGTSYQAEEGMTWAEWIESEYNVDGYYISGDEEIHLGDDSTAFVVDSTTNTQFSSYTILNNEAYSRSLVGLEPNPWL